VTRWVSSTNETEAAKVAVSPRLLADLDFASGMIRAHDGIGDLIWGANTYLGVGTFGGIGEIQEDDKVTPPQVPLKLAGVPNETIGSAMTESYQGRSVVLYWGFVDSVTGAWVATPETLWEGVMDVMNITLGANESTIELLCDDPDYTQPFIRRYTLEDHQIDFPGDRGFEFLPKIPGYRSMWGAKGYGSGLINPPSASPRYPWPFSGPYTPP